MTDAAVELSSILSTLGVKPGETVFLSVDMARVPLLRLKATLDRDSIREREERWCEFLYDRLFDAIGANGTLLVGAYTDKCGDPANPFVVEETPSEIGPFTEWLRRHPRAVRSVHPVFSVAGVGRYAGDILNGTGTSAFGPTSPFGRLSRYGTRFVALGVPLYRTITYVHHMEQCHGCNHRYHKVFMTPVFKEGVQLPGPYLGYVRWRDPNVIPNLKPLEAGLMASGAMVEKLWNGRINQSAHIDDVERVGYALLAQNPCVFAGDNFRVDIDESAPSGKPVRDGVAVFTRIA